MSSARSSVILSLFFAAVVLADAQHPPQDVYLIYPTGVTNVNQPVALGYGTPPYIPTGLTENVTLHLQYPDGTDHSVFDYSILGPSIGRNEPCVGTYMGSQFVDSHPLPAIGHYTALWTFTYITSQAGVLDANGCPAAPLSYQSFALNASFEVQQLSTSTADPATTSIITTQLSAQPTGLLPSSTSTSTLKSTGSTPTIEPPAKPSSPSSGSSSLDVSRMKGWYGAVAGLVGVSAALGWLA